MKLSPKAIKQMYPQAAGTKCDEHGDQSRTKVPNHLLKVFANREDPRWACAECVKSAKATWLEHQSTLRKAQEKKQKDYRASIKEARELARNADRTLVGYVSKCKNAVDTVKSAEASLENTRIKIASARNKQDGAWQRLNKAEKEYEAYEAAVLQLLELSQDQFEALEKADSDVGTCYNELREKLNEADNRWDELGKSVKKKRDKANKKSAMELLKDHEQTQRNDAGSSETTGDSQSDTEVNPSS